MNIDLYLDIKNLMRTKPPIINNNKLKIKKIKLQN